LRLDSNFIGSLFPPLTYTFQKVNSSWKRNDQEMWKGYTSRLGIRTRSSYIYHSRN